MCCSRLAVNTGCKKLAKNRHLGTIAQLCRAISLQLRHVSTIGKNLLSSNISSRCPRNMVNFGLLVAEIISLVWGNPANFNAFRVLAALLHGTLVVGFSQTAALNRGRHLHSAGRPSGWALAHISSSSGFPFATTEVTKTRVKQVTQVYSQMAVNLCVCGGVYVCWYALLVLLRHNRNYSLYRGVSLRCCDAPVGYVYVNCWYYVLVKLGNNCGSGSRTGRCECGRCQ